MLLKEILEKMLSTMNASEIEGFSVLNNTLQTVACAAEKCMVEVNFDGAQTDNNKIVQMAFALYDWQAKAGGFKELPSPTERCMSSTEERPDSAMQPITDAGRAALTLIHILFNKIQTTDALGSENEEATVAVGRDLFKTAIESQAPTCTCAP